MNAPAKTGRHFILPHVGDWQQGMAHQRREAFLLVNGIRGEDHKSQKTNSKQITNLKTQCSKHVFVLSVHA
jgi:hypothetical protein